MTIDGDSGEIQATAEEMKTQEQREREFFEGWVQVGVNGIVDNFNVNSYHGDRAIYRTGYEPKTFNYVGGVVCAVNGDRTVFVSPGFPSLQQQLLDMGYRPNAETLVPFQLHETPAPNLPTGDEKKTLPWAAKWDLLKTKYLTEEEQRRKTEEMRGFRPEDGVIPADSLEETEHEPAQSNE